ncbi:signal peptidase I [Pseudoflavonifractor capillosus]|uniref:Signal peptidase I n=1 Tax=Pseudoflavonifractor capillosus TaxID=106588 RepID=A0A921MNV8_9FIRM|nr:signal peptidase I [Pseudoflavonifractor capillosus]HJG87319.1 signal peptidase I [Pseudoflavonifractor capillosus]
MARGKRELKPEIQSLKGMDAVKGDLYIWLQAFVLISVAVVLCFTYLGRVVTVSGSSMEPTLRNGDMLLLRSGAGGVEQGDVVVLTREDFLDEPIVKRVIATEGQTVVIDYTANSVTVDGERLKEPYVVEVMAQPYFSGPVETVTVPEGCIFVMGDNRNHSSDSRHPGLGTVDLRCVLGEAKAVLLPLGRMKTIH